MPPRRRVTLSLESKLPLMVGSLLFIVITTLALASYTLGTDAERLSASIRLEREASEIAGRLHTGTRGTLVHGQTVAAQPDVQAYLRSRDPRTQAAVEDTMRYAGLRPEIVLAVELLDAGGTRLVALGPEHTAVARLSVNELTAAEVTGVGNLHAIRDLPAFPAVTPVRVEGERLGWVVVWWSLVSATRSGQGVLYVGSVHNQIWTDLTGIVTPPEGDVTADVMPLRYPRNGRTQLAAAAPVAETPWLVLIEADDAVVLAPTRRFLARVLSFALGVFVLACGAVWFMTRRITQPLKRLTDAATAISAGDYSSRVGLSGQDEIGRLAHAFDHMAGRVQSAHEALRAIVDEAPVAVYSLDIDAIVRSWNPAAERIFGWTAAEAIGQQLRTIPEGGLGPADLVQEVVTGQLAKGIELPRLRKDGSTVTVRVHAGPMHDGAGAVNGLMVVATDTTELRRMEHQYRHAQKMEAVGRLAGGIAHDFNNLLTVILGESEMALQELDAADPSRPALEEIGKAGHRAGQLTRQLLSFSQKQIVEPTVFDLTALVADVERMLGRLIGEDVQLVSHLAPDVMHVRADRSQIEQVVINLAVNARDAMPRGGLLTIELDAVRLAEHDAASHVSLPPGDYCVLSVNDSGVGMSEEVRSHIFEPFFTTKGPGRGTGLGLATCYGIVSQAGGHIYVYSELGVGSSFKVYLPKVLDTGSIDVGAPAQATSVGHEHILLVEDQAGVRDIAARMLRSLGYQVTTAEDGETALQMLRSGQATFDLLLTDVVLPGINGGELAEQARVLVPGLHVLFASGYTGDVAAYQALVDAHSNLIQKPFTVSTLGERVRQALDG